MDFYRFILKNGQICIPMYILMRPQGLHENMPSASVWICAQVRYAGMYVCTCGYCYAYVRLYSCMQMTCKICVKLRASALVSYVCMYVCMKVCMYEGMYV